MLTSRDHKNCSVSFDQMHLANNTMKLLSSSQAASASKAILLPAYKEFPNSSLHNLPLVIYRPFETPPRPNDVESLLEKNGYQAAWRYGMCVEHATNSKTR